MTDTLVNLAIAAFVGWQAHDAWPDIKAIWREAGKAKRRRAHSKRANS